MTEEGDLSYAEKTSKVPLILLVAVLVVGTVASVFGTRAERLCIYDLKRAAQPAGSKDNQEASIKIAAADGEALIQARCTGCHAQSVRLIGPSWSEIARHYSADGQAAGPAVAPLVAAIDHPPPGWPDYPQGPYVGGLSQSDRRAIAAWILQHQGGRGK